VLKDDVIVMMRVKELTSAKRHHGSLRLPAMLWQEGLVMTHKRIDRLDTE